MRTVFNEDVEFSAEDEDIDTILRAENELSHYTTMCELNRQRGLAHARDIGQHPEAFTLYKTVDKKVRPVDTPREDKPIEFGCED